MKTKYSVLVLTTLAIVALGVAAMVASSAKAANTSYYVDCSAGSNGSGTQASPWNNLATVNGTTFGAGDQILLKRGTTCVGQLWPKGSGVSGNPITMGAYGTGARPIIDANNAFDTAIKLFDQQYWVIDNLEAKNSTRWGVIVNGSLGASLNYFRLTNLYVHNVGTGGIGSGDGQNAVNVGLYANHSVHDVVIDNVETSFAFRGIETGGPSPLAGAARSSEITIRNSIAHDIQNDGMLAASSNNVLMENNVVYNSGIMPILVNHTPNGLWTWDCDNCIVQSNEVSLSHSPSFDGGAFDIDYFNNNNTVQYNYAHDNDAYCVAILGGDSSHVTTNNLVRYNVCSNNVRAADLKALNQGEIHLGVWSRGKVQDTHIYNNTIYYNPVASSLGPYYAINLVNISRGSAINNTNIYNNIIYSTAPQLVNIAVFTTETHMNNNLYWYTGAASPSFKWGNTAYTSFSAWKTGSGQDANSLYVNPMLNDPTYHADGFPSTSFTLQSGSPAINAGADLVALGKVASMGTHDFFGNAIPNGAYDIGAYESGGAPIPTSTPTNTPVPPTPTNTPTTGPSPTPTSTLPPTVTNTPLPSGTNLALNKPVTVSTYDTKNPGPGAVDGSISTYWRSNPNTTLPSEWITVDLGSVMNVSQVKFTYYSSRYPTAYTVQVSQDNVNWTTVVTVTGGTGNVTHTFASTPARYVKQESTAWVNGSNDRIRIAEFEIYQ